LSNKVIFSIFVGSDSGCRDNENECFKGIIL
jgi:hypothetical protein